MDKAAHFENESKKLKSELNEIFNMKSNDKVTFDNDVIRIRKEAQRELESERRKHDEELNQLKGKQYQQKNSIEKVLYQRNSILLQNWHCTRLNFTDNSLFRAIIL